MDTLSEREATKRQTLTLSRLSKLPVFNQSALKLLTVATDSDSARDDFEKAFRSDPSLTTDLLILANSPEFGFRAQVTDIRHAISLLGLERARSLACTIAMSFYLRSSASTDISTAWKHSIASAALASHVAGMSSLGLPLLYTAALLHDIGRMGLLLTSQKEYGSLAALEIKGMDESLGVERVLFGMNHCEAGAAMSRTWGFPDSLQRNILLHHGHVAAEQDPVTNLVQAACRMAEALGYPESSMVPGAARLDLNTALPPHVQNRAGLTEEQLAGVVDAHFAAAQGLLPPATDRQAN
jgi:putative nucleotidyltransferase with HDIG domain